MVIADKRDKTRTVRVDMQYRHEKYGKIIKQSKKYHVHDESNESHTGDRVEITNCRPLSKTKCWRVIKIIEKAPENV